MIATVCRKNTTKYDISTCALQFRGVRHAFKSRTLWLKSVFKTQKFSKHEISFQNTKSVFKTQDQFSKHKISFQNANSVLKTQITAQIHKISFQNVNTSNYKSVKLRFLSVMTSLFNALPKFIICRRVFKEFAIYNFILFRA